MKNHSQKIIVSLVILNLLVFLPKGFSAELGFLSGLNSNYFGEVELFTGRKSPLKSAGQPNGYFISFEKVRLSFLEYNQYSKNSLSESIDNVQIWGNSSLLIKNEILSALYQLEFSETLFAGLGLGLFKSVLNSEMYLDAESGNISVDYSSSTNRISSNDFNLGPIAMVGLKKSVGNIILGLDMYYINKKIDFEPVSNEGSMEVDIGGIILLMTAGVSF